MACFVGKNTITCYSGIPEDCVSRIKTKFDGKIYLSTYSEKLFKVLKNDAVLILYYRKHPVGDWCIKKFIKSAVEFIGGLEDLHSALREDNDRQIKAIAVSAEVD